jgi:hypothetical protein
MPVEGRINEKEVVIVSASLEVRKVISLCIDSVQELC